MAAVFLRLVFLTSVKSLHYRKLYVLHCIVQVKCNVKNGFTVKVKLVLLGPLYPRLVLSTIFEPTALRAFRSARQRPEQDYKSSQYSKQIYNANK